MNEPTISVVVPLYNHEKFVAPALLSVICQSYPAKEIIVIDDGSTDRSADIVEAIAEVHPEIIFWRQRNRGAHATINAGIHRAESDLVAILNSDDVYEPERLKRVASEFSRNPVLDIVVTSLRFINERGQDISYPWYDQAIAFYRECSVLDAALINGNIFMTTSNMVVRRRLFYEIGFFSNLRYAHDLDFLLRALAKDRKLLFIEEPHLRYRLHETNTISEGALKVKIEWAACTAIYLKQLWGKRQPANWTRSGEYVSILRKHGLSELVMLFMAYFDDSGATGLALNTFRDDQDFMSLVQKVLQ